MAGPVQFDPDRARGPSDQPDVVGKADAGTDVTAQFARPAGNEPLTVSALLARIKSALADRLPGRVLVVGELSNVHRPASGHLYFTLKDDAGQLTAVMFRTAVESLRFDPTAGLEVVAEGRVDVYEAQGRLQLYVERLTPRGQGALELAFRQLAAKLTAEGLFDPARKRPVPRFPHTIGIVTSSTGAAIRDIARTLSRRWPAAGVYLVSVPVQGEGAAAQIARAIRAASAHAARLGLEVLIVARGGGSIEDLWCFNEEVVARAIYDCRIPVVTGIGHEVDTTIADLVADVRAATPTAAAVAATPDRRELAAALSQLSGRLRRICGQQFDRGKAALRLAERSEFFRNPLHRVRTLQQAMDDSCARIRAALLHRRASAAAGLERLTAALRWQLGGMAKRKADALGQWHMRLAHVHPAGQLRLAQRNLAIHQRQLEALLRGRLAERAAQLENCRRTLEALSYRAVLKRGFSVTRDAAGIILRQADQVAPGQEIRSELAEGEIRSIVSDGAVPPAPPPPRPTRRKAPPPSGPSLFEDKA